MALRSRLLTVVFTLFPVLALAQPAPIGPPPATATAAGELSVAVLTGAVRSRAQATVDETNARLKQEGRSTRVSIESLTAGVPSREPTTSGNRPNSWVVVVRFGLTIKVAIPLSFDRHIFIPIDVRVFCDNWFTSTGNVTVRSAPGPASIEGGNIIEDVLHIRDLIDSRVRNAFTAPLPATVSLPGRCKTIGAFGGGTATPADDTVKWDVPRVRPGFAPAPAAIKPTVIVTFGRLKRLQARSFPGNAILYNDAEDIWFRSFADYSEAFRSLTMREGDDVALNLPPIRLDAGTFDSLVVIGNVEQQPFDNPRDSVFTPAATRAQSYGPGSHILQIPKWYSRLDPVSHKPIMISVPAYELTYTVQFVNPGAVSRD